MGIKITRSETNGQIHQKHPFGRNFYAYRAGRIPSRTGRSRTISQNNAHSLTIFAFDKGEEISTHSSHGDALITVLDGEGRVTIDGKPFMLHKGESVLMPAGKPHSVFALEKFKMLLVVVFPLPKNTK